MKPSYFVSERIRLRAMEPEDLETMYAMENDPQTWDVTNFSVPYSKYVLKQYMENSQCDMFADRQLRMMIVRCEDNAVVGTIDITDLPRCILVVRWGLRCAGNTRVKDMLPMH